MSLHERLRRLERAVGPTDERCPNCYIHTATITADDPEPPLPPCTLPGGCLYPNEVRLVVTVRPSERRLLHVVE